MEDWFNESWGKRFKIISDYTKVTNSNDVLYYDLSNAPAGFWNDVKSDGSDIRITKSDGTTLVAREVIGFDLLEEKGALWFNTDSSLSTTIDTDFYVYYDNSSATEPAPDDEFGREGVWGDNWKYVHHFDGDATDSSKHGNNGSESNITYIDTPWGKGASFNGTNAKIDLPTSTVCQQQITVKAVMKTTETTTLTTVFFGNSGNNRNFTAVRPFNAKNAISKWNGSSSTNLFSTTDINTGDWFWLAGARDSNIAKVLVNGIQENSTTSFHTTDAGDDRRAYGYNRTGNSNFGKFDVGYIHIYEGYLSNDYLLTSYNNESDNSSFWDTGAVKEGPNHTIQGTVTLDGNPVEGADVRLINTTDDIYIGSFTTPADGTYSFTNLLEDKEYHALVQYKDGSNDKYNSESLPFLSPEEVDDV